MIINGLMPAIIREYDASNRYCRVEILGLTDGSDEFPVAEIANPLGDKSTNTEIEILSGDLVWVMFHGGDSRYPIVCFYRTVNKDASVGTRRTHHLNIEITADELATVKVGESLVAVGQNSILFGAEKDGDVISIKLDAGTKTIKVTTPDGSFDLIKHNHEAGTYIADGIPVTLVSGAPVLTP